MEEVKVSLYRILYDRFSGLIHFIVINLKYNGFLKG